MGVCGVGWGCVGWGGGWGVGVLEGKSLHAIFCEQQWQMAIFSMEHS